MELDTEDIGELIQNDGIDGKYAISVHYDLYVFLFEDLFVGVLSVILYFMGYKKFLI